MQYKITFVVDAAKVGDLLHPLIVAKVPFDMEPFTAPLLLTGPKTKDPKGRFAKQLQVLFTMPPQVVMAEYMAALKAAKVKPTNPSAHMVRLVRHGYVLRKAPGFYDRVTK
jgi:hypothetical protein